MEYCATIWSTAQSPQSLREISNRSQQNLSNIRLLVHELGPGEQARELYESNMITSIRGMEQKRYILGAKITKFDAVWKKIEF